MNSLYEIFGQEMTKSEIERALTLATSEQLASALKQRDKRKLSDDPKAIRQREYRRQRREKGLDK
jgi:short subunit dehydrogenase-like uncharacterized protein